jgi:hypothetical protein
VKPVEMPLHNFRCRIEVRFVHVLLNVETFGWVCGIDPKWLLRFFLSLVV